MVGIEMHHGYTKISIWRHLLPLPSFPPIGMHFVVHSMTLSPVPKSRRVINCSVVCWHISIGTPVTKCNHFRKLSPASLQVDLVRNEWPLAGSKWRKGIKKCQYRKYKLPHCCISSKSESLFFFAIYKKSGGSKGVSRNEARCTAFQCVSLLKERTWEWTRICTCTYLQRRDGRKNVVLLDDPIARQGFHREKKKGSLIPPQASGAPLLLFFCRQSAPFFVVFSLLAWLWLSLWLLLAHGRCNTTVSVCSNVCECDSLCHIRIAAGCCFVRERC